MILVHICTSFVKSHQFQLDCCDLTEFSTSSEHFDARILIRNLDQIFRQITARHMRFIKA